MAKFEMGDIIDNEYLVVDSFKIGNKEYIYVTFNNTETTFLEVYEENEENYIRNIDDDKEFERVAKFFAKRAAGLLGNK